MSRLTKADHHFIQPLSQISPLTKLLLDKATLYNSKKWLLQKGIRGQKQNLNWLFVLSRNTSYASKSR